jgi:glycosyltransferase involved in cell wall biosynthesis
MYKVSVVIPVYNAEPYIERCIRSLYEQTLDSIEYIFVNDCSPDNSIDILKRLMEEYPERAKSTIILEHEKNTGQSGARRDGMRIASGEFIIHCDADDWVDLDAYESMYRKAKEDDVEAVCCDIVLEHENNSIVLRVNNKFEDHQLMYDCKAPISVEYFSMCNRLVSRKVFERNDITPFKGVNMWDDVGLSIRVRYHVSSTSVINKEFYHYNRMNEVSTTRRPLIDRTREQNLCIACIEDFFRKENAWDKYRLFVTYLTFHSNEELFFHDAGLWRQNIKKVRWDLWKIRKCFRSNRLVKFYTVGFGGFIGKLIWRQCWKR